MTNQPKRGPMPILVALEKRAKTWENYARNFHSNSKRTVTKTEALRRADALRAEIARLKSLKPKD